MLEIAKVSSTQQLREVTQLTECQALMECWVHLSRRMKRTKAIRSFPAKSLFTAPLSHLSFSESGTFLLAVTTGLRMHVFDIEDMKTCHEFDAGVKIRPDQMAAAVVVNTGEVVVIATMNGRLISFASETGTVINEDSLHMSIVTAMRANEESTKLIVGYDDSLIRLLTLPGLTTLLDLKKQYIEIKDVCMFGDVLGSVDKSGHTLYWDTERNTTVERLVLTGMQQYTLRGTQVLGRMDHSQHQVLRTVNAASKHDQELGESDLSGLSGTRMCLQLGEDGKTVFCLLLDQRKLLIYDLETMSGQDIEVVEGISRAAINPGYPLLAVSRIDDRLELWAVEWELEKGGLDKW